LLLHGQIFVHLDPKVLLHRAAFQTVDHWHVLVPEIIPPQVQDFAFPLAELHEISLDPVLQLVKVPLNGGTTIWYISHSSQFCIICEHAHDVLFPIVQMVNENIEQDWPQYQPLAYTATDWPPTRFCAAVLHFKSEKTIDFLYFFQIIEEDCMLNFILYTLNK